MCANKFAFGGNLPRALRAGMKACGKPSRLLLAFPHFLMGIAIQLILHSHVWMEAKTNEI